MSFFPSRFKLLFFSIFLATTLIGSAITVVAQPGSTTGVVLETMDAAQYTYLKVETNGESTWVAIPATPVEKGQQVTYTHGMVMENFASRTLGRTFAAIVFSPGLVNTDVPTEVDEPAAEEKSSFAAALQKEREQPKTVALGQQHSPGSGGATTPFKEVSVDKATGENSYTVSELYAKAEELNGKTVRLRARVVKINPQIMGKNWIHLQDGTGDPMQNSHNLVATSAAIPQVDQVVVVEGVISANMDFGFGYNYEALLEEAVFSTNE